MSKFQLGSELTTFLENKEVNQNISVIWSYETSKSKTNFLSFGHNLLSRSKGTFSKWGNCVLLNNFFRVSAKLNVIKKSVFYVCYR